MNQQTEHSETPNPYHVPREYEFPDPEAALPPAPEHHSGQSKKPKKSRTWLWLLLAIILLAGAGAAAYMLFLKSDPAPKPAIATTEKPKAAAPASDPSVVKSAKLNIELTKPSGWSQKTDTETGAITLTSPETTYLTNGASVKGAFVLRAQQGLDAANVTFIHSSAASADSLSIGYTAPTQNQYQYSLVTTGGPSASGQFLILYNMWGYKKGDILNKTTLSSTDPLVIFGGFTGKGALTPATFDKLAAADFLGSPEYKQAIAIIESLKAY